MTDYRALYDKEYLGAWDCENGDMTLTIKNCIGGTLTGMGGRKSKKPVVYFKGTEKGLALNATNGKMIASMYGTQVEKWAGKKITLFKSTTTFGSESMDCLRVRPTVSEPESDDPDDVAIATIGVLTKRKKFDEATDLCREIKDETKRTETEAKIAKAKDYVAAQTDPATQP